MKSFKLTTLALALITPICFSSIAFAKVSANKDGESIAFVMAVDNHEIKAAKDAEGKDVAAPVMDYAKMLKSDHTKNLEDTKTLSDNIKVPANETKDIKAFEKNGDEHLTKLDKLKGKQFQNAYLKAMVKGHQDALTKLDRYIKQVSNPQLKDHLIATRATVKLHLEDAKKLEK